ncbi:MAG: hypothetical protein OXL97_14700 [Chloroflexota bacterium]|nr:hypothetical protein [Chloroflexota bacterium]MDE2886121.1 hypothetical protein [Chloroflexota bacterium]
MVAIRTSMLVLAVLHALFVLLTAMAGAFADAGSLGEWLLVVVVHPLAAAGLLALLLAPRLPVAALRAAVTLLVLNVAADLVLAVLIARGSVKGDWELAVVFAVVPAIGIVFALTRSRFRPA